ncbi:hypothetical protein I302_106454 [Kwoniella bestiolae CBS 10118]|uniref:Uncharacterized protein n=1 Tax=Kwoniella bestiolae CBS 10118 TaxID=1296100 RepID=A0A1B9G1E6_9TREE|nr:hypothetical protein I302_06289 [Kwoniella bestiolae CBS 10118]OCF24828.1 hypothetical protein I302_06289 [Kwoniella bestiolae CBS 10118]
MDSYLTSPDAETGYEMKDEDHWWSAEQQELGRMQWDQMTGFPTTNFSAWDTAAFGHGRAPSFLDESHGNDNGHEVNDIDPTRRLTGYAPTIGLDAIYDCRGAGSMVHAPRTLDTDTTPACPEEESEEVSGGGADDGTKSTKGKIRCVDKSRSLRSMQWFDSLCFVHCPGATNDTWSESELREIELLQMDLSRFEAGSLPQTIKDWAGTYDNMLSGHRP